MPAMFQGSARPDTVEDHLRGRSTTTSSSPLALVAAAPTRLRRGLPADVWCGVPCWWSAERWVAHVRLVYLRHYQLLRPVLVAATGGGVSLEAVLVVAATHAGVADHRTGRSSRPLLGTSETTTGLVAATGFARRTVSRVRTFLRLAGLVTEVAGGRHRSLAERMESWRRGDRARGWTAVYALHPSRTHPIDRSPDAERRSIVVVAHWSRGGTPPRSGSVPTPPPVDTAVSTGEPHRHSRSRQRRTPDAQGLDLALRWRRHPRAPAWVMAVSPAAWSALLALPARHGWTAADLNQLLHDHIAGGLSSPTGPTGPWGSCPGCCTASTWASGPRSAGTRRGSKTSDSRPSASSGRLNNAARHPDGQPLPSPLCTAPAVPRSRRCSTTSPAVAERWCRPTRSATNNNVK